MSLFTPLAKADLARLIRLVEELQEDAKDAKKEDRLLKQRMARCEREVRRVGYALDDHLALIPPLAEEDEEPEGEEVGEEDESEDEAVRGVRRPSLTREQQRDTLREPWVKDH